MDMNQVDGKKMPRKIAFDSGFFSKTTFGVPLEAIDHGKFVDKTRKSELGLNIISIQGKVAKQFYWNPHNLVVEFDDELYLRMSIQSQLLDVHIEKYNCAWTNREIVYDITYSDKLNFLWTPQKIAEKYIGKVFNGIELRERSAWLHFQKMHFLIHCVINKLKESENLFLSWIESE